MAKIMTLDSIHTKDEETIAGSDFAVKIPMRETVDSLNVAAASAVAFWEVMKEE